MRSETFELKNPQNGLILNEETLGKSAEKWGEFAMNDFEEIENDKDTKGNFTQCNSY